MSYSLLRKERETSVAKKSALTPDVTKAVKAAQQIETELNEVILEREEPIRMMNVCVVSKSHGFMLGVPGTGKSLLVKELTRRICSADGNGLKLFDILCTRFTVPEEFFGPVSIIGLKKDEYRRNITNMLPTAELAFLDEVWRISSAVYNTLLKAMEEREYKNGTETLPIPLVSVITASNDLPQGEDLAAGWDRIALRIKVDRLTAEGRQRLHRLKAKQREDEVAGRARKYTTMAREQLTILQQAARAIPIPEPIFEQLYKVETALAEKGIYLGDRRWMVTHDILRAHALLEGQTEVVDDNLLILKHVLWEQPDHIAEVTKVLAQTVNPILARALEIKDEAVSAHQLVMATDARSDVETREKMDAAVDGATKLRILHEELQRLITDAGGVRRAGTRVVAVEADLKRMRREITDLVG